jgi:penicillin-binding protein A
MMEGVVTAPEGTGHSAAITDIPGVVVGGKTGTADTGRKLPNGQDEPPDAWFIGYAMANGVPKIAVAVIIENGGVQGNETTGGEAAAPVARAVMEAYLKAHPG